MVINAAESTNQQGKSFNGFNTPPRLIRKHESHYNSKKRLLTGFGVTFGSLLNCPHSLACQPCHFLFAEGAIEIPRDGNLVDSLLSIKKVTMNSTEYLQPTE